MTGQRKNRHILDRVMIAIPYVLPVLGGLLGVAYVNSNPTKFLNPVTWIGAGAIAGWIVAWLLLKLIGRMR